MRMAYRTLVIRRRLSEIDKHDSLVNVLNRAERVGLLFVNTMLALVKIYGEEEGIKKAREYLKSLSVHEPDLKYFIKEYSYFAYSLLDIYRPAKINGRWIRKRKSVAVRVPAIFDVQVRLSNERDTSRGIFVDLRSGVLRIRRIIRRKAITIPLKENEVKYIKRRLEEGAALAFAFVWTSEYIYIGLVFRRRPEPYVPRSVMAVDVNSMLYGVVYGIIKNGEITYRKIEPPLRAIKLYREANRLSRSKNKKMKKRARKLRSKAYRVIKDYVNKAVSEVVRAALEHKSEIWVDTPRKESIQHLLADNLPGDVKIAMSGIRRFVKLLRQQAQWYGITVKTVTLSSRRCPRCSREMQMIKIEDRRIMRCDNCGFLEDRDKIPIMWAKIQAQKSPSFSSHPSYIVQYVRLAAS